MDQENTVVSPQQSPSDNTPLAEAKKAYPWARHLLLVGLLLLGIATIFALIYLNGRSIYRYGI